MDLGHHFGPAAVVIIMVQQQLTRLLVQGGLRVGDDQQAFDRLSDVTE